MNNDHLKELFTSFSKLYHIDHPTLIKILEDVFKAMILKKYGSSDNFDIIINIEKGDLQIWHFQTIVEDHVDLTPHTINISMAKKVEKDFEIGEELAKEVPLASFGRTSISFAKNLIIKKIKQFKINRNYQKYSQLIGEIITGEVLQTLKYEIIIIDNEQQELILPKSEQIDKDRYKKGQDIKVIVKSVECRNHYLKIIASRTSPQLLIQLFKQEIPEIADGIIQIKKAVRQPGQRAKVVVTSQDDLIDPVGACIGMKGARIHSVVRELRNESIDVIHDTNNQDLFLARTLSPAKINKTQLLENGRIAVYLLPDQVSLAVGKNGQNIKLASELIGKPIDVYKELSDHEQDIHLDDFLPEIDAWVIQELKNAGFYTAKSILALSKKDLEEKLDLEHQTIEDLYQVLSKEFS